MKGFLSISQPEVAPFGLDASDPKFWDKDLSMIAGFIDELEAMEG
jgi:oligoendopeptidase F